MHIVCDRSQDRKLWNVALCCHRFHLRFKLRHLDARNVLHNRDKRIEGNRRGFRSKLVGGYSCSDRVSKTHHDRLYSVRDWLSEHYVHCSDMFTRQRNMEQELQRVQKNLREEKGIYTDT